MPGIKATTGPLCQGISSAVGMAIAECVLAAEFNLDDINEHLSRLRNLKDG